MFYSILHIDTVLWYIRVVVSQQFAVLVLAFFRHECNQVCSTLVNSLGVISWNGNKKWNASYVMCTQSMVSCLELFVCTDSCIKHQWRSSKTQWQWFVHKRRGVVSLLDYMQHTQLLPSLSKAKKCKYSDPQPHKFNMSPTERTCRGKVHPIYQVSI